MGQLEDLRLFTLVVENSGISKAASKLNIAKSAVSRRLGLLEDRYSAKLINRTPGRWEVTDIGRELYQRATAAVDDFEEIDSDFKSTDSKISGPLAISMPREFGLSFLSRTVVDFKNKYPQIQMFADFDDRLIDIESENYDYAVRITLENDKSLIKEKIGAVKHYLCAAKSYLDEHGSPETLQQLKSHKLIYFGATKRGTWKLTCQSQNKAEVIDFTPSLNSNSGQFVFEAALSGQGIAILPDFILGDALDTLKLVPLLPDYKMEDFFIYLVHSEKRRINRRMRLFSQEIKSACSDHLCPNNEIAK